MSSGGGLCFCYGAAAALCEVGRPGPAVGRSGAGPCWGSVGGGARAVGLRSGVGHSGTRTCSVAVFVVVCGWAVVLLYLPILQAVYMEQYRTLQFSINLFIDVCSS